MAALLLGAGRERKEDAVDPLVGLSVFKKVGDFVTKGDVIGTLYANRKEALSAAKERFLAAYTFSADAVPAVVPVYGYVDEKGYHALS